jgi:enterochelin esterase family protein
VPLHRRLVGGEASADQLGTLVREQPFPLAEDGHVTFLFQGDADDVRLRHWIFGLPSSQPFQRIEGTDFWYVVMELPRCSRVEYKIERIRGEQHEWIMDPLNPRVAHDPFGANSVCYGEGYVTPDWTRRDPEARPGKWAQLSLESRVFNDVRRLRVYLPARFRRRRRYPLLLIHDGEDYVRYAELKNVLDNLVHRLEIAPFIAALSQPADRLTEYGADRRHARHLVEELVPHLESRFPLIQQPAARVMMGASFGAVAALHAAWCYPQSFGGLLLQSGSFAFSDIGEHGRGPAFDPVARFVNEFRESPGHPADKVFVSCGIYESLIYENRSIVPLLQGTKMDVRYVEARDGHNWDNWRDRLRESLSWLFPGPLWMVYE